MEFIKLFCIIVGGILGSMIAFVLACALLRELMLKIGFTEKQLDRKYGCGCGCYYRW